MSSEILSVSVELLLLFSQYSTEVKLMFNLIFRVLSKCMNVYLLYLEISSNKHLESFFLCRGSLFISVGTSCFHSIMFVLPGSFELLV